MDTGFYACTLRLISEQAGITDVPVSLEVYSDVGVSERPSNNDLLAVPNPSGGETRFMFPGHTSESISRVEIRDISGRVVFSRTFSSNHHQMVFFDWSGTDTHGNHLPDGLYFVSFLNTNKSYNTKLIISR
jgi:flagellar hook assembly protein FlgD